MSVDEVARQAGERLRDGAAPVEAALPRVMQRARRRRQRNVALTALAVASVVVWMGPQMLSRDTSVVLTPSATEGPAAEPGVAIPVEAKPCTKPKQRELSGWQHDDLWDPLPIPPLTGTTTFTVQSLPPFSIAVFSDTGGGTAATFDLTNKTWNCTSAPLVATGLTTAADDVIYAWDGDTTAVFDPRAQTWTELPPAPVSGQPLALLWTEEQLLVWSAAGRGEDVGGAAFDPSTATWTSLPPAPVALNAATAVWDGRRAYLVGSWLDGSNQAETATAQAVAFDTQAQTWRTLPDSKLSPQASSAGWVGDRLLAWDYEANARSYDPDLDRWTSLPRVPITPGECYPDSHVSPQELVAWYCGQMALWDATTGTWIEIDVPQVDPAIAGELTGTAAQVLIVSPKTDNMAAGNWLTHHHAWAVNARR